MAIRETQRIDPTLARTETSATPELPPGSTSHTITATDTPQTLARAYGFRTPQDLFTAIGRRTLPAAGETIVLPPQTHTVGEGDSVTTLRTRYGTPGLTAENLRAANPGLQIDSEGRISGATEIRVPRLARAETTTPTDGVDPSTTRRDQGTNPTSPQLDPPGANRDAAEAAQGETFWQKLVGALETIFCNPFFHGICAFLSIIPGIGQVVSGLGAIVSLTTFLAEGFGKGNWNLAYLGSALLYTAGVFMPGVGAAGGVLGVLGGIGSMDKRAQADRLRGESPTATQTDRNLAVANNVRGAVASDAQYDNWRGRIDEMQTRRAAIETQLDDPEGRLTPAERQALVGERDQIDRSLDRVRTDVRLSTLQEVFGLETLATTERPTPGRLYRSQTGQSLSSIAGGNPDMERAIRNANGFAADAVIPPSTPLYIPTEEQVGPLAAGTFTPALGTNTDPDRQRRLLQAADQLGMQDSSSVALLRSRQPTDADVNRYLEVAGDLPGAPQRDYAAWQSAVGWLIQQRRAYQSVEGRAERVAEIDAVLARVGATVRDDIIRSAFGVTDPAPASPPTAGSMFRVGNTQNLQAAVAEHLPPNTTAEDMASAIRAYNGLGANDTGAGRLLYMPTAEEVAAHKANPAAPLHLRESLPPWLADHHDEIGRRFRDIGRAGEVLLPFADGALLLQTLGGRQGPPRQSLPGDLGPVDILPDHLRPRRTSPFDEPETALA